jgi:polyisoprenoid-binding protein YceI
MRPSRWMLIGCFLASAVLCGGLAFADTTAPRAIDPSKSSAQFSVEHIFVSRVTGKVPILSGEVNLAEGSAIPVEVTAVLDPNGVDTGDHDRDKSLESSDYFDTAKFPTWTFASTKIVANGPNSFGMDGTLTIHGVGQPEHLDVSVSGDPSHPVYHVTGHIDRKAFGMKGARLDPVIGSIADVTLEIVLK